jgi:large subunit ribosomal protein L22
MEAKAIARHVRISPRKVRQVVDLIRGKNCDEALAILRVVPNAGAEPVEKVLRSAIANAENNYGMDPGSLYVFRAMVDGGPTLKRIIPRMRGMANRIRKRTSHITVVVKEKEE